MARDEGGVSVDFKKISRACISSSVSIVAYCLFCTFNDLYVVDSMTIAICLFIFGAIFAKEV